VETFTPFHPINFSKEQLVIYVQDCAAKAFYDCPAIISHRPRSQNISKERALNLVMNVKAYLTLAPFTVVSAYL
jgi:hypothetical protein